MFNVEIARNLIDMASLVGKLGIRAQQRSCHIPTTILAVKFSANVLIHIVKTDPRVESPLHHRW